MHTSIDDLETRGFVAFSYPAKVRTAVLTVAGLWKQFCALPIETKKALPYSNNADGVGYELKDGVGTKADRKENFDITTGSHEWLQKNVELIQHPVALEFLQNATALIQVIEPLILDFARESEKAFGLEGFGEEVSESKGAFFLRFIHYFGDRQVGDETATAHVDQSGFTPHLFESTPGLECLTYDGTWIPMPVSEGETVIIPAMQMQLRSNSRLKALCHRVVATRESARGGRYSAVCFVQLKNTPKYDKGTQGRLQEKEAGFNYVLPPEEFAKLFKK